MDLEEFPQGANCNDCRYIEDTALWCALYDRPLILELGERTFTCKRVYECIAEYGPMSEFTKRIKDAADEGVKRARRDLERQKVRMTRAHLDGEPIKMIARREHLSKFYVNAVVSQTIANARRIGLEELERELDP